MNDRQEDEGIGQLIARALADGRAYAGAELAYWRALAIDRLVDARTALVLAIVVLLLAQAAAIALVVGLVMTLTPYIGPALATLVVVIVAGAAATVLAFVAVRRFRRATRPRNEP